MPHPSPRARLRSRSKLVAALVVPFALLAAAAPDFSVASSPEAPARAVVAPRVVANPLVGHRWGVYKGRADQSWAPYAASTGAQRRLLGKISLRPKAKWFGAWIPNGQISSKVDQYIANSTGGDSDVLVQMTVFRLKPWEHDACRRLPTAAEQSSYKQWINRFARAVGNARVALILQPDGPFALCAPHGSKLPSHLIRYASRTFSALPRTSVYIDAGASDWPYHDPAGAASILMPAGIGAARGFALNSTHYVSTSSDIAFGTRVVAELARRGVAGKHFVINTAENGKPFEHDQARGNNFDNSPVCRSRSDTRCVTLGIPPTTHVASTRWGLSAVNRSRARAHVDGYLWFGRPWLYMQADPFVKARALALARTTPY